MPANFLRAVGIRSGNQRNAKFQSTVEQVAMREGGAADRNAGGVYFQGHSL